MDAISQLESLLAEAFLTTPISVDYLLSICNELELLYADSGVEKTSFYTTYLSILLAKLDLNRS